MLNGIDRRFHDNRWWVSVQGHSVMIWRDWSWSDTSQLKLDVLSRLHYVDGPGTQVFVLRHCCAIDDKNGSPTTAHCHIEIVDPYDAYNTKHLQISTLSSLINRWHFITDQHLALWRSSIVRIGSCTDSPTLQCYVHCTCGLFAHKQGGAEDAHSSKAWSMICSWFFLHWQMICGSME